MGEGVQILERNWHESNRCQDQNLHVSQMVFEPNENFREAFTKRSTNAVENNGLATGFNGLPTVV